MTSNCEILQLNKEMPCDTPVPFYDMGISCGLPTEMGDVPPEMMLVPSEMTMGRSVIFIRAQGDSMTGVNIHDGDLLMVEPTSHLCNFDIVAAKIDGRDVLKTYYIDECGRHWLVPSNEKYDAILMTEEMDVRFVGRLVCYLRMNVKDTTRNIRLSVERTLNKMGESMEKTHALTREEAERALLGVAPQIKMGRHWLGPCRVLIDCGFIPKNRYDLFCDMACNLLPDHQHPPREAELRRMAVDCFSKPFDKWRDETAPVHGKAFQGYYNAGNAVLGKLPKYSQKLPGA